uniref:fibropellin-3-like isoform X1 n=1 Tax=Ciona intestinalis TaxID=7719 RepID=UPI00089DD2A5|nr:fibropellin-3-like isoform X1 [Ciona intestinalis]|eukprot:XP_018671858.1 fibropellin-3-like isoform X1 [Ciona intestinalis]
MPHSPLWVVLAVLCLFTLPPDISAVRPPDHFQTKSVSGHGIIYFNTGSYVGNFGLLAPNDDQAATAVIYVNIWSFYSSNYTLRGNVSASGDVRHFSRANGNLYETVTNVTQNTEYTVVAEVLDDNNVSIVNFTANVKTVTARYFSVNDLTSTPKEITTPGWPNNYPDNVFYFWNLTADPGFKIELTLYEGESEIYDQLYAYEPHTRFYFMPLFWIIGNVTEPKIATSNSSNVLIYFASDASVNKKGFRITYIQTGGPDPEPTTAAPFVKPTPQVTGSGGNELIHIDLHSSYFNYTITFNAINTEVMNADSYIIEGLVNDQSYEIEVIVKDGGVIVETFTLEVKTSSFCTTSCTNSVCALENGVLPVCKCKPGYTENMNDSTACVDIHECGMPGIDCPVNSVCSNTVGSFVCRCVSGYTLVDGICEVINLCETSTLCMNGGSCSPLPNDYKCDCPQYYSGKSCQSYTSPCISGPCKNLGTCNDLSGSFNCSCTVAYKGSICETDADECQDGTDKCVANSMCSNTVGSHACTCNEGYTGDGFVKCNEIRLLDYGPDTDVLLTPIRDGVSSPALEIPIQLPFGRRSFDVMFVTSNGLITLGRESWWVRYLWRPYQEGFGVYRVPLIAPFWEDFHPHRRNEGRVYYQVRWLNSTVG